MNAAGLEDQNHLERKRCEAVDEYAGCCKLIQADLKCSSENQSPDLQGSSEEQETASPLHLCKAQKLVESFSKEKLKAWKANRQRYL
tara:strand:+ start:1458 stop:1718 length:261 start_codon:yes stop_codon:yes gene_type:complete